MFSTININPFKSDTCEDQSLLLFQSMLASILMTLNATVLYYYHSKKTATPKDKIKAARAHLLAIERHLNEKKRDKQFICHHLEQGYQSIIMESESLEVYNQLFSIHLFLDYPFIRKNDYFYRAANFFAEMSERQLGINPNSPSYEILIHIYAGLYVYHFFNKKELFSIKERVKKHLPDLNRQIQFYQHLLTYRIKDLPGHRTYIESILNTLRNTRELKNKPNETLVENKDPVITPVKNTIAIPLIIPKQPAWERIPKKNKKSSGKARCYRIRKIDSTSTFPTELEKNKEASSISAPTSHPSIPSEWLNTLSSDIPNAYPTIIYSIPTRHSTVFSHASSSSSSSAPPPPMVSKHY